MVEVSVIILNWNGLKFLETCLTGLFGQDFDSAKFEIVLVDNGSSDGSVEWLRENYADWLNNQKLPYLKLVELSQNQGFSGGNLAGLEAANPTSRYIATLNNDTEPEKNWLSTLYEALEKRPRQEKWAAAGGAMLFASDKNQIEPGIASAGIEVRRDGLALDSRIGERLNENESEQEIFGVCAGAALYCREALDEVGFFDPAFFAYLEDADLAWRLRLAGWKALYVPNALVWHEYSGTGGQGSPFKSFQLGRNRVWTILKNWPVSLLLKNSPFILFYDIAASGYTLLKRDIHPARGRLAALHPKQLRRVLAQRQFVQQKRKISLAELESWLNRAASPTEMLALRRTADEKASTPQRNLK